MMVMLNGESLRQRVWGRTADLPVIIECRDSVRFFDRWARLMDARAALARRSAYAPDDDELDALTDQMTAIESAVIAAPDHSPGALQAKVDLGFALWREGCPAPSWFEEMVRGALCPTGRAQLMSNCNEAPR